MAAFDSPELRTLQVCTPQLETALKGLDRRLVHFLQMEGFFSNDIADEIQNPRTLLTVEQKTGELVKWIKNRIQVHPRSYHVLLHRLKQSGQLYQPIVWILEAEYTKQLQLHPQKAIPTDYACPPLGGSMCTWYLPQGDLGASSTQPLFPSDLWSATYQPQHYQPLAGDDKGKPQPQGQDQPPALLPYLKTLSKEESEKLLAKLKFQSETMQNKFASLVCNTMMSLKENKRTAKDIKVLMKFSSAKELCDLFKDGMSINDLFLELGDYLSFFDYELLELIIKQYCSGLSTELEKYKSDLKEYCRRRIIEVPMHVIESKRTDKNVIHVKYEKEFCSITLNDIKVLEVRLAQLLETDLCLLGVEEGCTQLVLGSTHTITSLTDQQRDELVKMEILEFHMKNVHFESKAHLSKTKSYAPAEYGYAPVDGGYKIVQYEAQPRGTHIPKLKLDDDERKETLITPKRYRQEDHKLGYYQMASAMHGVAFIINNKTFADTIKHGEREGTDRDEYNLLQTCAFLGYRPIIFRNLTSIEIKQVFENLDRYLTHSDNGARNKVAHDSFICCILSHGDRGVVFGSDSEPVELENVEKWAGKSKTLRDKPKIFFIQARQGTEPGTEAVATVTLHGDRLDASERAHIYTCKAICITMGSTMGSWFVIEVCKILCEFGPCYKFPDDFQPKLNQNVTNNKEYIYQKDKTHIQQPVSCYHQLQHCIHFFEL